MSTDPPQPPYQPSDETAQVSIVRGRTLAGMTRDALDAIGGIGSVVQPGETVFIKPNFGAAGMVNYNPVERGDCTKPEVVLTVAEECLRAGAAHVTIGDAGQVDAYSWADLVMLDGSSNMADAALALARSYGGDDKITLACLNADSPAWDAVRSPYSGLGEILVSSHVTRVDRIISVPVIKTHRWCRITASLKNFMGVTPASVYGRGMNWRTVIHDAPGGLHQTFIDVVNGLQPDLTIIDGSVCVEGNGPHAMPGYWGDTVDMKERLGDWLILASRDLVAADATVARLIGQDPENIRHVRNAYRQGMGQLQEDRIALIGERLDHVCVEFKPAELTDGFLEVLIPGAALLLGR
jgi:uncharacterized protein (DUF362 family)